MEEEWMKSNKQAPIVKVGWWFCPSAVTTQQLPEFCRSYFQSLPCNWVRMLGVRNMGIKFYQQLVETNMPGEGSQLSSCVLLIFYSLGAEISFSDILWLLQCGEVCWGNILTFQSTLSSPKLYSVFLSGTFYNILLLLCVLVLSLGHFVCPKERK